MNETSSETLSNAVLLDTHIVLWLANGDGRLRPGTRDAIDRVWRSGGTVLVSAVTGWEIALLAEGGRIDLGRSAEDWLAEFVDLPGVEAVPLTWQAAARAYALPSFPHRDPADRLLVATAIELGCRFVTYDARLAAYAGRSDVEPKLVLLEEEAVP